MIQKKLLIERRRLPLLDLLFNFSFLEQIFYPLLIPVTVLGISLMGSWHCAGMCGGLITIAAPRKSSMIGYQIGRLLSYEILGIIFGLFGKYTLLNMLNGIIPIFVSFILGLSFIGIGISHWRKTPHFSSHLFSKIYSKLVGKSLQNNSSPIIWNGFKVGFLSVFLPCGWLYSFILVAVLTQNPYYSALLLFFFWLGSVPTLSLAPIFIRKLLKPIYLRFPKVISLIFVMIGLFTIGLKIYPLFFSQLNPTEFFCMIPSKK